MKSAGRGTWVQIYNVALAPRERSDRLPADTARVPLELRVKGFLCNARATLGDKVMIRTTTGRKAKGKLIAITPAYDQSFGQCRPELLEIGQSLKKLVRRETP